MAGRPIYELARLLKDEVADGAETVMTRAANEFATVTDVDPLRISVHSTGMDLAESDLFFMGIDPDDLDVDDSVLLNVVGDEYVLVGELGDDSFDKLAQRLKNRGSGAEIAMAGSFTQGNPPTDLAGEGWAVARTATGIYRVTFDEPFDNVPLVTVEAEGLFHQKRNASAAGFDVRLYDTSTSLTDGSGRVDFLVVDRPPTR